MYALLSRAYLSSSATGGPQWRETMRALYGYYRRDMRDAREQRAALYPKTHAYHVQRTVPFLWALVREMATAYVEAPLRRFLDPVTREPLPEAIVKLIDEHYRLARVNAKMRQANEQLVALNCATVHVWPDERTRGVKLLLVPPHDQDVRVSDPTSTDESAVIDWRLAMPVGQDESLSPCWAEACVTPASAVWVEGPSEYRGKPIFAPSGGNPLGRVPVVMLRGSDPGAGEWWPPANEDLVDASRAVNHDFTDIGHVARLQGYSQPVAIGVTAEKAKEIEVGPETTVGISGEGVDFKFASPTPDLEGYGAQNRDYRDTVVATQGMNPATFARSAGITALAKQIEIMDRNAARRRALEELRSGEQRLYDLIRDWVNYQGMGLILPNAIVEIEFREPAIPVDRLHDAQALELEDKMGIWGRVRERARREAISPEEAERRIISDLTANARIAASVQAGIGGADVSKTALNGAQVTSLQGMLQAVASGQLPGATAAVAIRLAFPGFEAEDIEEMVNAASAFTPSAPMAPVAAPAMPTESSDDGG